MWMGSGAYTCMSVNVDGLRGVHMHISTRGWAQGCTRACQYTWMGSGAYTCISVHVDGLRGVHVDGLRGVHMHISTRSNCE
jgi:hypothetical protein